MMIVELAMCISKDISKGKVQAHMQCMYAQQASFRAGADTPLTELLLLGPLAKDVCGPKE